MKTLINYARIEGLTHLFGDVLTQNAPMLKMCSELGFTVETTSDDPTVKRVTLDLARPFNPDGGSLPELVGMQGEKVTVSRSLP